MKLTKKKARVVGEAITLWMEAGALTRDQGRALLQSYEIVGIDWRRLARYAFLVSLACILISAGAVLADDFLRALLAKLFRAPETVKSFGAALLAAALFRQGLRCRRRKPHKVFSNEAVFFLGVLATAASIAFLGSAMQAAADRFSLLFLLAAIVYGFLGMGFPSKLVWVFSLLSLGSWLGAETGYVSGWGAYYLGMSYPLRFVLFGGVLTAASGAFRKWEARQGFVEPTRVMGLLYLFIALWILSIFGNHGDLQEWKQVKPIERFHWSLLFGLAGAAAVYHGLREDDAMTRGFGLTFLFINLYTRFFEYFWEATHKAVFFALLAASFWVLGSRAESIWRFGKPMPKRETGQTPPPIDQPDP